MDSSFFFPFNDSLPSLVIWVVQFSEIWLVEAFQAVSQCSILYLSRSSPEINYG